MNETWEQTKERLRKQGVILRTPDVTPKPYYDETKSEMIEPRFNLRRTVLPGVKVEWLVVNAPKSDIDWWLAHKHRFKKSVSIIAGVEPVELWDVISVDATEEQRSPYYNDRPVIKDDYETK